MPSKKITVGFEIQCQWVICLLWHCLAKKILFRKRNTFIGADSETLLLNSTCSCEIHWYLTTNYFSCPLIPADILNSRLLTNGCIRSQLDATSTTINWRFFSLSNFRLELPKIKSFPYSSLEALLSLNQWSQSIHTFLLIVNSNRFFCLEKCVFHRSRSKAGATFPMCNNHCKLAEAADFSLPQISRKG